MLTRAVSAPVHYNAPGILRYDAESLPPMHSVVKFAPLPQTELFGRRAKFSSKLGVQGRSGILNKQRQHPAGINYDLNNVTKDTAEDTIQEDCVPEPNGYNPIQGSTFHQVSEKTNLHSPRPASSLGLRRSASEDGTISTSRTKRASLKFWKRPSKRPELPTIPSQAAIHVLGLPPRLPQTGKEPHVGASGVPPAPHVGLATPPNPVDPNQELQIDSSDGANSSMVESLNSPSTPSSTMTSTFTPHSSIVPNSPTKDAGPMSSAITEPTTEGASEQTRVEPVARSHSNDAATSEIIEPLEVSIRFLDEKGTAAIAVPPPTTV